MELSKKSFEEILKKYETRFPKFIGRSTDLDVWKNFCKQNPIEFRGILNGADAVLKITKDGYAIALLNPTDSFSVYSF